MKIFIIGFLIAVVSGGNALAQGTKSADNLLPVEVAVKECVVFVKAYKADAFNKQFFVEFDAFYNRSTRAVQTNAYLNYHHPPLFRFNKCMSEKGFPLGG